MSTVLESVALAPNDCHPPAPSDTLALTVDEAARTLRISRSTFYEWVKAGEIAVSRIRGRTLVRRVDLEELLARRLAA